MAVHRELVLGSQQAVDRALEASVCSRTINTSFVERQRATDQGQNARKARRTYRFSKDWRVHEAMTYFTLYRYNFCWIVADPANSGRGRPLAAADSGNGSGVSKSYLVPRESG